jgi:hypothetical protein
MSLRPFLARTLHRLCPALCREIARQSWADAPAPSGGPGGHWSASGPTISSRGPIPPAEHIAEW